MLKKIRQFTGLRATDSPPTCRKIDAAVSSQRQACQTGGPTIPSWSATSVKRRSAAAASTCSLGCPTRCIRLAIPLHASPCRSIGLLRSAPVKPNGKLSQRKSSKVRDAVSGNWFGTELRLLASALSIRTWRQRSFLGWRVDPGLRCRVVKVMDYEAFRQVKIRLHNC